MTENIYKDGKRGWSVLAVVAALAMAAGCSDDDKADCEAGEMRCNGDAVEICGESGWEQQTDCAEQGEICYLVEGEAVCVPGSGIGAAADGGALDGAVDGGMDGGSSFFTSDGGLPPLIPTQECPAGEAWQPIEGECVPCGIRCDGIGEDGLYETTTVDDKCICKTQDGYFLAEAGLMPIRCDKDQDGWVNAEAIASIESIDPAYQANARCNLRTIDRIVLEPEWAPEGEGKVIYLKDLSIPHRGGMLETLPLYEVVTRDVPQLLANDEKIKPYGEGIFEAAELNGFTKACVDDVADYNGNDVADLDEWDQYDRPPAIWENLPELAVYARFGYFMELHWGWYERPAEGETYGAYHIREKSRLGEDGRGVPIKYEGIQGSYWKRCMRQTDVLSQTGPNALGMDFARYNGDRAGFNEGGGGVNLLENPGAESAGVSGWTVQTGVAESLEAGQCEGGTVPHGGQKYFVVGGNCGDGYARGELIQKVSVEGEKRKIDSGTAMVDFGGYLADWQGYDTPGIELVFLDGNNQEISRSQRISSATPEWTYVSAIETIPVGTRSIVYTLIGQRSSGTANNSYFDDVFMRIMVPTTNALKNSGAEGYDDPKNEAWIAESGPLQILTEGECGGVRPHAGDKYLVSGGIGDGSSCAGNARTDAGEIYQEIGVAEHKDAVDAGEMVAIFGGWLQVKNATAKIVLRFLDGSGNLVGSSKTAASDSAGWKRVNGVAFVPAGTEAIRFTLLGEKGSSGGRDNGSFFDDLYLKLTRGAWMHHHSQFKCVRVASRNDTPEHTPHLITMDQILTESPASTRGWQYQLNECNKTGAIPAADGTNPADITIECEVSGNPAVGDVGFAVSAYNHYPRSDRGAYVRGCINECEELPVTCNQASECEPQKDDFGMAGCGCIDAWIEDDFEECTICPGAIGFEQYADEYGRWFLDDDDPDAIACSACQGNWNIDDDCKLCKGNWDEEAECDACKNHWIDEVNDCGTCPGNWDPEQACNACKGFFDSDNNCETCLNVNFDPQSDCRTCRQNHDCTQCTDPADNECEEACLGQWDLSTGCIECAEGWDPASGCVTCKENHDPTPGVDCQDCIGNWDIAADCLECKGFFDIGTNCSMCLPGYELDGGECITANLLKNGGAESGTESWDATSDDMQSFVQGHCDGGALDNIAPQEGSRFFHVGGDGSEDTECETDYAAVDTYRYEACQTANVDNFSARINQGGVYLTVRGYIRWANHDDGGYIVRYLRADGTTLETRPEDLSSDNMRHMTGQDESSSGWEAFSQQETVPAYTEKLEFCMVARDMGGNGETDVYFDDLSLKLE